MRFIYEEHSLKPGIYKILNIYTNRVYIGQAKEFKERWRGHKYALLNNKHQNKFLLNDFNKCREELGHDDFLEFHVLEVMEGSTKEERNKQEQFYIHAIWGQRDGCYNFKQKIEAKERQRNSNIPEETRLKKSGQKQERTEWHRIVVWGKLAELCQRYLSKGRKAYVEGKLQTRAWDDKDGNKRYTTEIVASTVQFLDSSADKGQYSDGGADAFSPPPDAASSFSTDDIPF
jgi:single-strand DNA-binding protein